MSDRYAVLHYAGDRRHLADGIDLADYTRPDGTAWPLLCGSDVFGLPYEVLDVEYDKTADRSTVHLGPAQPDTLRAHEEVRRRKADEFLARRPGRIAFLALFSTPQEVADLELERARERAAGERRRTALALTERAKRRANARARRIA